MAKRNTAQAKQAYQAQKSSLQKEGYTIFKSASGNGGSWSYKHNGQKSAYGFDSECDVVRHLSKETPNLGG